MKNFHSCHVSKVVEKFSPSLGTNYEKKYDFDSLMKNE